MKRSGFVLRPAIRPGAFVTPKSGANHYAAPW